ncbi:MAG: NAD-dependent epimerase/dehydratase family protein [Pseudomonadota bacterium]
MGRSVAIIGAGQIGHALAEAFAEGGWETRVLASSAPRWPVLGKPLKSGLFSKALTWRGTGARFEPYDLATDQSALCADLVVDTIAFDHGYLDRYSPALIGRLVVISSASVYCDAAGRTLDEAAQNGWPEFAGPITEEQTTVAPDCTTYSTRKVRMEQRAAELFGDRATILRPGAIYGPYSRHPREWWFVKRLRDRRRKIPLMHFGKAQFHTTNAADIGRFAHHAAEHALGGVYNVVDQSCPSVSEIADAMISRLDDPPELVLLDDLGTVGRTPWSVSKPFIVSSAKASASGFTKQSRYTQSVSDAASWLWEQNAADWKLAFPQLAAYPYDHFDYEAEDRYFAGFEQWGSASMDGIAPGPR